MGWNMPWSRRSAKLDPMLDDDVIRQALEHRFVRYACLYQQHEGIGLLRSARASTPDLYIRINGRQGAYVHQWRLRDSKTAVVEHFAVETEFVGKGFGLAIARGLASALRDEFETETIVFSERAYSEAHERFFKRLGAVPSDSSQYPGKPDWAWSLATAAAD